jgi:hypothetical protein
MHEEATQAYRQARRDFIAACRQAGADTIARVHPEKAPDGKPLFCDSAAFGPREADRALLLIDAGGARLLAHGLTLRAGARLLLVHGLDPFAASWGRPGEPRDWPQKTLAAIAVEDVPRARTLTVLGGRASSSLKTALASALPEASIAFGRVPSEAGLLAAIAAL